MLCIDADIADEERRGGTRGGGNIFLAKSDYIRIICQVYLIFHGNYVPMTFMEKGVSLVLNQSACS